MVIQLENGAVVFTMGVSAPPESKGVLAVGHYHVTSKQPVTPTYLTRAGRGGRT